MTESAQARDPHADLEIINDICHAGAQKDIKCNIFLFFRAREFSDLSELHRRIPEQSESV